VLREERLRFIIGQLRDLNMVSIQELSKQLNVSYMTIWRDLLELESRGLVKRIRGGAVPNDRTTYSQPATFSDFEPKTDPHYEQKACIGRYAAMHLVEDNDIIAIEAGTTASAIVQYLGQKNLTVLTNGLMTAYKAASLLGNANVICSGGVLIDTGAFIGPQAEGFFSNYRAGKAFISAKGLTLEDGFTDPTPLYNHLKNEIRANAERVIVLMDSSKFGVRSLVKVLDFDDVDVLVTDSEAPKEMVEELRQRGIDVRLASLSQ